MLFLYLLIALTAVAAAIFATPLRRKVWTALVLTAAGALWCSARAVGVLAGADSGPVWSVPGTLFGGDTGSMDGLSALFVVIISVGAVAAVLYSRGYLAHCLAEKSPAHISLHYTALVAMFYAMLGVVLSDGGFSFLFFWELMTVASFLLILFDAQRREVRRAALSYLIMMHIGFVLLVIGFVRLDAACGAATFGALGDYFRTQPGLPLLLVFLAGFGMKAGLFPMHVWLPEAHPAAPSHVSALMSGVMIKTGVYGILRVTAALGEQPLLHTAGVILLAAGVVTGLWGVILAAMQNDVKRLLAYSSIENVGVILIGLGVAALGKSSGNQLVALCGVTGALLHTLNHSLFKSLLFFGAGNILSQTHTTSLDALGGLAKHMPLTAILFLTGTAAICALPPLNGFVSELLIYLGMLDGIASGSNVLASAAGLAALALIGGLVVLAFTKLYGTVFLGSPRTHEVAESSEADTFRIAAMALPLAGILFVGLFPRAAVSAATRARGLLPPHPGRRRRLAALAAARRRGTHGLDSDRRGVPAAVAPPPDAAHAHRRQGSHMGLRLHGAERPDAVHGRILLRRASIHRHVADPEQRPGLPRGQRRNLPRGPLVRHRPPRPHRPAVRRLVGRTAARDQPARDAPAHGQDQPLHPFRTGFPGAGVPVVGI